MSVRAHKVGNEHVDQDGKEIFTWNLSREFVLNYSLGIPEHYGTSGGTIRVNKNMLRIARESLIKSLQILESIENDMGDVDFVDYSCN
jgi:hypothetical protein